MKVLVCSIPGKFDYELKEKPKLEKSGHTLLKIKKVGICGTDYHAYDGTQPYFSYPRILGHEIAAEIEETTPESGFSKTELVTISPYFYCGNCIACRNGKVNCCEQIQVSGVHTDGAMAEYIVVPDYSLISGEGLSADELVLVEPLAIGAHGVRKAMIKPGEFVLVIGAGPIGLATMEFAMIAGAEVIVMDYNTKRLDFCRYKLGVKHIINPDHDDIIQSLKKFSNGDMPTVVIDCSGNIGAINASVSYMAHGGRLVLIGLQKQNIMISHPEFHKREGTLMSSRNALPADFKYVVTCIKQGLVDPLKYISQRIPFDHIKEEFSALALPGNNTIKAVIEF